VGKVEWAERVVLVEKVEIPGSASGDAEEMEGKAAKVAVVRKVAREGREDMVDPEALRGEILEKEAKVEKVAIHSPFHFLWNGLYLKTVFIPTMIILYPLSSAIINCQQSGSKDTHDGNSLKPGGKDVRPKGGKGGRGGAGGQGGESKWGFGGAGGQGGDGGDSGKGASPGEGGKGGRGGKGALGSGKDGRDGSKGREE